MTMNLVRGTQVHDQARELAVFYRALSEPMRLIILHHLATGEHNVRELTGHLGLAQSTVSAHLSFLERSGLVVARVQGRSTFFRLAAPEALQRLWQVTAELVPAGNASPAGQDEDAHPQGTRSMHTQTVPSISTPGDM